jgi:ABC-2 type transport system permease protein
MSSASRFAALDEAPFNEYSATPRPGARAREFFTTAWQRRELLGMLARRDLKSRYKDSALGFAWVVARPLTQLAIYYVVIGRFLGAARNVEDFAVFVFTGLTVFGLFSEIVSSSTASIVGNSALVKKVALPREMFPLASVGSALFNFGVQLVILFIAALALGPGIVWSNAGYALMAFMLIVILASAIGLALAALNVFFRDTQYLVEVVMLLLMWASPIVYSWSMAADRIATYSWLGLQAYTSNPITLAVLGFQKAFWASGPEAGYPGHLALRLGIAIVLSLILLLAVHRQFVKAQGRFAQEL